VVVQTAKALWGPGAKSEIETLCDSWIEQSTTIKEEEQKTGLDPLYRGWVTVAKLFEDMMAAYGAATETTGEITGAAFSERFVQPALVALAGLPGLIPDGGTSRGPTEEESAGAKRVLTEALTAVDALSRKDLGSVTSLGRSETHENDYWMPLYGALKGASDILPDFCPRMVAVDNVATTCNLAKENGVGEWILLLEGTAIMALATRTLGRASEKAPWVLNVEAITVAPALLRNRVSGYGGTLMEHIVREALTAGALITLKPIGSLAQKIYSSMGFTSRGEVWVMGKPAQLKYVAKHGVYARTFKSLL
jgi:hypothetical protein